MLGFNIQDYFDQYICGGYTVNFQQAAMPVPPTKTKRFMKEEAAPNFGMVMDPILHTQ